MKKPQTSGNGGHSPGWPTLEQQFATANAIHGSALEALIRDNQDFAMLRPEESRDQLGFPPWLRVYWRKHHPEATYSATDPTGGYPRTLRRLHQWMLQNQHAPLTGQSGDGRPAPQDGRQAPGGQHAQ